MRQTDEGARRSSRRHVKEALPADFEREWHGSGDDLHTYAACVQQLLQPLSELVGTEADDQSRVCDDPSSG